ncbi:MAG: hypothetical protein AAF998_18915 [Bacteroidota bacterium]
MDSKMSFDGHKNLRSHISQPNFKPPLRSPQLGLVQAILASVLPGKLVISSPREIPGQVKYPLSAPSAGVGPTVTKRRNVGWQPLGSPPSTISALRAAIPKKPLSARIEPVALVMEFPTTTSPGPGDLDRKHLIA